MEVEGIVERGGMMDRATSLRRGRNLVPEHRWRDSFIAKRETLTLRLKRRGKER